MRRQRPVIGRGAATTPWHTGATRTAPLYTRLTLFTAACPYQTVANFILRLLAITVCGGGGGFVAWLIVSSLGGTGVGGGIASAMLGMLLAVSFWAGGVALIGMLKRDEKLN
jgi:hypothetical protein